MEDAENQDLSKPVLFKRFKTEDFSLGSFTAEEVLYMLLSPYMGDNEKTKSTARLLLSKFGGIGKILSADIHQLCSKELLTAAEAENLKIYTAFLRHLYVLNAPMPKNISDIQGLTNYIRAVYFAQQRERLYVIALDKNGGMLGIHFVCEGERDRLDISISRLKDLLFSDKRCKKFALVHNHPDGTLRPSENDIETALSVSRMMIEYGFELTANFIYSRGRLKDVLDHRSFF